MQNTNFDNIDILKELENIDETQYIKTINIEENLYETIEFIYTTKQIEKKVIKRSSLVSTIIFLSRYIITSTLIFAVLLITTNYSAYINIAKSYLFSGQLQASSQKLITSVEAANIKDKYSEEKIEEKETEKEEEKLSIKKMKKDQDKENLNLNIEITPYENRIIIPKIGKNIPLIDIKNRNIDGEKELNDIFMKELENGIIRYPGSAKP
jgi:hypothetical protein